jgi:hypothetical protein
MSKSEGSTKSQKDRTSQRFSVPLEAVFIRSCFGFGASYFGFPLDFGFGYSDLMLKEQRLWR